MSNEIRIYRGDSLELSVPVTYQSDGTAFDLTGYTAKFTAKSVPSKADSTAAISVDGTISSPSTGIITFSIAPDDTDINPGVYWYDVQIVDTGNSKVFTVVKDKLTIVEDVTRTGIPAT